MSKLRVAHRDTKNSQHIHVQKLTYYAPFYSKCVAWILSLEIQGMCILVVIKHHHWQ